MQATETDVFLDWEDAKAVLAPRGLTVQGLKRLLDDVDATLATAQIESKGGMLHEINRRRASLHKWTDALDVL